MELTIKDRCYYATISQWQTGRDIRASSQVVVPGTKVQYIAHVPGGMVKARHNGQEIVIHPGATIELA